MDLLSQAMEEVGLQRAVFRRWEGRGDTWAVDGEAGGPRLHAVRVGACDLWVGGRLMPVDAGDVAVVPAGAAHRLTARGSRPTARAQAVRPHGSAREGPGDRIGAPSCMALSGTLTVSASDHPMLSSLGDAYVVRAQDLARRPGVAGVLAALETESEQPQQGSAAVTARLAEVLFIESIRAQASSGQTECPAGGWFRGLQDPALSRALSAFHADPRRGWTVALLARAAGQSRSAFSARFAALLGEPPLTYVRRWRLFHARRLLRTTPLSLDEVAARIGYGSAAALSLAFTRESGQSPGAWRATHRTGSA